MTWKSLRKGNLNKETESFLIASQKKKNVIRTNNVKVEISKRQRNRLCRFCGDRNETANHIIGE